MAFDCFLYFDKASNAYDIIGESQDEKYKTKGAIEITSYSFGIENPTTIGSTSGGAGSGKAVLKEFSISKKLDSCSPNFFTACATGGHYTKAYLDFWKSGGKAKVPYLKFTYSLIYVKDITWNGSTDDEQPTEDIVFVYGALRIDYTKQDKEGKVIGSPITAIWNQVNNNQVDTVA